MSDEKKKGWFVRLMRAAVCLCLLVVIGVWVAKIWIAPSLVRSQASSYLGEVWSGTIEIDEVDVSIFGPSYVRGVTVRDSLDRTWLSVPKIRLDVAWDGFTPSLSAVRVDVVNLSPQFVDGKCNVPLKSVESSDDGADIVEIINDLAAVEMTVDIVRVRSVNRVDVAPNGERLLPDDRIADGIAIPDEIARDVAEMNVVLPRMEWRGGRLKVEKILGEISDNHISVDFEGRIESDRSITLKAEGLILEPEEASTARFEVSFKPGGAAKFAVHLAGQIQVDLLGDIQPDGSAETTLNVSASNIQPDELEWLIGPSEMVWLALEGSDVKGQFKTTVKPDMSVATSGRIDTFGQIGDISAIVTGRYKPGGSGQGRVKIIGKLCDGKLQADFKAMYRPDAPVQLALEATANQVKMTDLTRVLMPHKVMKKGLGSGTIRIGMSGSDIDTLSGKGAFFLDDADLWQAPILAALFRHRKLKLNKADIQGSFELAGPTATAVTGQMATMVWAADFQKGGTINFDSGDVDMYVIFLPVKQAGVLMNLVKAVNPLRLVANEVFRLHVTGKRGNPKITPVPFSDLTKLSVGTLGFLKSVTASGGQLTGETLKAIMGGGK